VPNASRATVNTAHNNTALKVSHRIASKRSEESTRRLLDSKKLSLVVDLDQTIIHATVDPTVAEWQKDPENPNYDAVKDVKAFQLLDDGPGMRGCWYYIKLRPVLREFIEAIAQKYELHIYTMGTRAYAQNIAKIVDPQQKIFGDRILSRDESGSMTAKNLHRLFPVNTDMVVIIDDRGDVWSWSPNLVKVSAYDFFVGIGDINSSFLPKAQGVVSTPKVESKAVTNSTARATEENTAQPQESANDVDAPAGDDNEPTSELEAQLVAMAGGSNQANFTAQNEAQEEAIATQLEGRPLLRRQEALDQLDEAEEANGDASETSSEHSQKHRHNLLRDDDDELYYLQKHLENVHQAFFDEYDRQRKSLSAGRVAELRGEKTSPKKAPIVDDLSIVPDVKQIMPTMKEQVLKGVVICFTGVIPQGIDHKK
jgi:RNA polymerase II subunit A-like phosphatase